MIPRPKILTAVTIPSGGWTFKFYCSDAVQYDVTITVTLAAGDYYVAGDNQDDDLLYELQDKAQEGIKASVKGGGAGNQVGAHIIVDLDPDSHKVTIKFEGSDFQGATPQDVKLAWTECTEDLVQVLGFDEGADDEQTTTDEPEFEADWHHGYGWYAEDDGWLEYLGVEDVNMVEALRSRALDGGVVNQFIGDMYDNELRLAFVPRESMFSGEQGYGEAPVHPYSRNKGLECWWLKAREGQQFRVYRSAYVSTPLASALGSSSACSTTTLTDAMKVWETEPQRWQGRLLYVPSFGGLTQCFYIESHTATVLTVPNAHPSAFDVDGGSGGAAGGSYYIFDYTYRTYVIAESMKQFKPMEIPDLDEYDLVVPLFRYVA